MGPVIGGRSTIGERDATSEHTEAAYRQPDGSDSGRDSDPTHRGPLPNRWFDACMPVQVAAHS